MLDSHSNNTGVFVELDAPGWEARDPQLRTVVEGHVFLGQPLAEIAGRLQCSEWSPAADWSFARNWLAEQMDLDTEAA